MGREGGREACRQPVGPGWNLSARLPTTLLPPPLLQAVSSNFAVRETPLYHIVNAKVLIASAKLEDARKVWRGGGGHAGRDDGGCVLYVFGWGGVGRGGEGWGGVGRGVCVLCSGGGVRAGMSGGGVGAGMVQQPSTCPLRLLPPSS